MEEDGALKRRDVAQLIVGLVEDGEELRLVWEEEKTQLEYAREIRLAMLRGEFDEAKRIAAISKLAIDAHRRRKDAS